MNKQELIKRYEKLLEREKETLESYDKLYHSKNGNMYSYGNYRSAHTAVILFEKILEDLKGLED